MIRIESPVARLAQLDGARIVVLNWRDIQHPQAGGAEQYMHQIARAVGRGRRARDVADGPRPPGSRRAR